MKALGTMGSAVVSLSLVLLAGSVVTAHMGPVLGPVLSPILGPVLGSVALAQSDTHKTTDMAKEMAAAKAPEGTTVSDAQKTFTLLKTVAGSWEGTVTVDPPQPEMNGTTPMQVILRVTSRGNALVHEMREAGKPDDPGKYDHPVTMFYVDQDKLTLVHYCDAGNRPRMVARTSTDGKTVEFDFTDLSGGNDYGHMYHAVFTIIDANHHIEDWTYMMPGDKPVHARMDLKRAG